MLVIAVAACSAPPARGKVGEISITTGCPSHVTRRADAGAIVVAVTREDGIALANADVAIPGTEFLGMNWRTHDDGRTSAIYVEPGEWGPITVQTAAAKITSKTFRLRAGDCVLAVATVPR